MEYRNSFPIRDSVLGTFNVESPGTLAFDQKDLDFLTLFSRVVASSMNQLQLLEAEKVTAPLRIQTAFDAKSVTIGRHSECSDLDS